MIRIAVGPFLLGYIHPDEFFQGGQELFFGCPPTIPWEFEPENALRSVFPPAVMTWIPLQIYGGLKALVGVAIGRNDTMLAGFSGMEVLVVPRIACSLLSILVVDRGVWATCKSGREQQEQAGVPVPVLLLGSAWTTIGMMTRPFSNSMETFIFASLMTTVLTNVKPQGESAFGFLFCWKIGIISALGIFTRFTFVFFATPVLLFLLQQMIQSFGISKTILWRKLGWMAISFICVSVSIILADTKFYSMRDESNDQKDMSLFDFSSFVVTPFNALAYNSKISNLKDHGLHPRWTHAVVNMLIMFGPLTLATYFLVAPKLLKDIGRIKDPSQKNTPQGKILAVSAASTLFGLGFLSIAPHQEPRFLLPLLVPLVLLGEKPFRQFRTPLMSVWILFNAILVILFGILHQGGVTKSLLAVGSTSTWTQQEHPTSWIYMLTYMPPTFLTRSQHDGTNDTTTCSNAEGQGVCEKISFGDACQEKTIRIVDMKSSSAEKFQETIQAEISCSNQVPELDSNSFLYLVVPFLEPNDDNLDPGFQLPLRGHQGRFELTNEAYEWNLVDSFGPHLTTEDFPMFTGSFTDFYNKLALNIYNISCTEMT